MPEIVKEVIKCYGHCYEFTPQEREEVYARAAADAADFLAIASLSDELSETAYTYSSDQVQEDVLDTGEPYFYWVQAVGGDDVEFEKSTADSIDEYYQHLYIIEEDEVTASEMKQVIELAESEVKAHCAKNDIEFFEDAVNVIADEGSFIISWGSEVPE